MPSPAVNRLLLGRPSWVRGDVSLDFVNGRYWANGYRTVSDLIGGTTPVISATGLRCTGSDASTALGNLADAINGAVGFLFVRFNSTDVTNGNFPRIVDVNGVMQLYMDAGGSGFGQGAGYQSFKPDGTTDIFNGNYASANTENVAISWDRSGSAISHNNNAVVTGSTIKAASTSTPYLGNRADATRSLTGNILFVAAGFYRPSNADLAAIVP